MSTTARRRLRFMFSFHLNDNPFVSRVASELLQICFSVGKNVLSPRRASSCQSVDFVTVDFVTTVRTMLCPNGNAILHIGSQAHAADASQRCKVETRPVALLKRQTGKLHNSLPEHILLQAITHTQRVIASYHIINTGQSL